MKIYFLAAVGGSMYYTQLWDISVVTFQVKYLFIKVVQVIEVVKYTAYLRDGFTLLYVISLIIVTAQIL